VRRACTQRTKSSAYKNVERKSERVKKVAAESGRADRTLLKSLLPISRLSFETVEKQRGGDATLGEGTRRLLICQDTSTHRQGEEEKAPGAVGSESQTRGAKRGIS